MSEDAHQITPSMSTAAVEELTTLRDFLRWGVSQCEKADLFYGHGTDNSWDEMRSLAWPVLDLPFDLQDEVLDAKLLEEERQDLVDAITRRVNECIPAAYITNTAYFGGLPFYVDERVIVPRSPIAELIDNAFEPWLQTEPTRALDMCTGSGCIAIALAVAFDDLDVDAVDIDPDALAVAAINVEGYELEDRVSLIQSNLFDALPKENQYDFIVANPPYVPQASFNVLPEEYMAEPVIALVAGEEGLDCVIPILENAADYLKEDGFLILELGEAQEAFEARYPDFKGEWLSFENGGDGIFAISANDLKKYYTLTK
ncbi:MAG: 50S ribosomal protein L3 N(5)-glutamine methyltransferase [Gammaproteobacteria bacterium]